MKSNRRVRAVQRFSDDYLKRCKNLATADIVRFLEDYRLAVGMVSTRSRLISIRMPEPLLDAFKAKARLENTPYQTQIKRLMREWLNDSEQLASVANFKDNSTAT